MLLTVTLNDDRGDQEGTPQIFSQTMYHTDLFILVSGNFFLGT